MFDLVIIGAGPSGLSCALEAARAGLSYTVLDKGSVADAIRRFPTQLTFFSTPDLLEIGNVPFLSAGFRPTRAEVVRYYQRVAGDHSLNITPNAMVTSLGRENGHFVISSNRDRLKAKSLVVATGYFDDPAPYSVPGSDLPKVRRYYDEAFQYHGLRVAVIGGKNSAVEVALDLFRHGADVTLIHRGSTFTEGVKYWILPDIENRIKSGDITAFFETTVSEISTDSILVTGKHQQRVPNDIVFVMIGYQPRTTLLQEVGVAVDRDSLGPVHEPSTMETNIKGLFVAGSLAAGKYNNRIFIENGREHGRLIIDHISKKN